MNRQSLTEQIVAPKQGVFGQWDREGRDLPRTSSHDQQTFPLCSLPRCATMSPSVDRKLPEVQDVSSGASLFSTL
jgi:hypothetical protein